VSDNKLRWWGYLHSNGHVQVKRYFDQLDLSEARESPFCVKVSKVVEAKDREEAIEKVTEDLKKGLIFQEMIKNEEHS
jgi:hypothetical protein